MTNVFSGPRHRLRGAFAASTALFGLLALTACQDPTPLTTVTVGSDTTHTEATCYADGDVLSQKQVEKCLKQKPEKSIAVGYGDKIRVGVEPKMAEGGWTLAINGGRVLPEPMDVTYYSFPGDVFFQRGRGVPPAEKATVSVIALGETGGAKGVWHIRIVRED